MKQLITLLFVLAIFSFTHAQTFAPDLSKKEDLKALGIGNIVKNDGYRIKKITLNSVNANSIVYEKENNLHDYEFDKINWLEFPESKWGPLKIKFEDGVPKLYQLQVTGY